MAPRQSNPDTTRADQNLGHRSGHRSGGGPKKESLPDQAPSESLVAGGDLVAQVEILPPPADDEDDVEFDLAEEDTAAAFAALPLDEDNPVIAMEDALVLDDGSPPQERASRDIVPYDPLQAYLVEIRRHKPLTREQEHEFALKYFHHKDKKAAYKLVVANLWLVVRIARDYETAARNLLDLIQEGNIGLLEAVKNYDPYRQVRFPSYAAWWIKAYIIRFLISNWRLVKIGTTQAQRKLFFNLKREKERLEREGIYPGPRLIAQNLNVKESEVLEMEQRLGAPDVSVDAPISNAEPDSSLHGVLASPASTAEDLISEQERQELIAESLKAFATTLKEKERIIFERRLLGEAEEKATLQEISEVIHVSRERVRQIENRVKDKLKEFLVKRLGSSLEDILS